jgi:outer membrane receptor for Fe3+-dicitrate
MIWKAVNSTDSSLERGNNGRTGKTILAKGIGKLRVYGEINGKDFDATNTHKYQDLNLDTQFVNLNDVKKGFKLEWVYNDITEGLMVEKKNQNPFRNYANIVICSNLPLELNGASDKDRIVEFEFANYFNMNIL